MEPVYSLPHLQVPATCPYLEPHQSSPCPHIPLSEDPSQCYPPMDIKNIGYTNLKLPGVNFCKSEAYICASQTHSYEQLLGASRKIWSSAVHVNYACPILSHWWTFLEVQGLFFFIDIKSCRPHYGPEVDSASNRNEYQEHFLGVEAAGA